MSLQQVRWTDSWTDACGVDRSGLTHIRIHLHAQVFLLSYEDLVFIYNYHSSRCVHPRVTQLHACTHPRKHARVSHIDARARVSAIADLGYFDGSLFFHFVKDCRLDDAKLITKESVAAVFATITSAVTAHHESRAAENTAAGLPAEPDQCKPNYFSRSEWIEAIIRLAHLKFAAKKEWSIVQKVVYVLENYVLTHGNNYKGEEVTIKSSILQFRAQMLDTETQSVYHSYSRGIYALFQRFASGVFPHQAMDLSGFGKLLDLLRNCDLAPKSRQTYMCWALSRDPNLCTAHNLKIKYHEFLELMVI